MTAYKFLKQTSKIVSCVNPLNFFLIPDNLLLVICHSKNSDDRIDLIANIFILLEFARLLFVFNKTFFFLSFLKSLGQVVLVCKYCFHESFPIKLVIDFWFLLNCNYLSCLSQLFLQHQSH